MKKKYSQSEKIDRLFKAYVWYEFDDWTVKKFFTYLGYIAIVILVFKGVFAFTPVQEDYLNSQCGNYTYNECVEIRNLYSQNITFKDTISNETLLISELEDEVDEDFDEVYEIVSNLNESLDQKISKKVLDLNESFILKFDYIQNQLILINSTKNYTSSYIPAYISKSSQYEQQNRDSYSSCLADRIDNNLNTKPCETYNPDKIELADLDLYYTKNETDSLLEKKSPIISTSNFAEKKDVPFVSIILIYVLYFLLLIPAIFLFIVLFIQNKRLKESLEILSSRIDKQDLTFKTKKEVKKK